MHCMKNKGRNGMKALFKKVKKHNELHVFKFKFYLYIIIIRLKTVKYILFFSKISLFSLSVYSYGINFEKKIIFINTITIC